MVSHGGFIAYYRVSTGKPSLADIIPLSAASGYIYNIDAIGRCTARWLHRISCCVREWGRYHFDAVISNDRPFVQSVSSFQ